VKMRNRQLADFTRTERTAETLSQNLSEEGAYNQNIITTALVLVARGQGDWLYQTQYLSGATLWRAPDRRYSEVIHP
jgi:hypothetical protein